MTTVFEQMTTTPNRKCRAETLLRLLISTSYPQSILSDLIFDFAQASGINSEEDLENIALRQRNIEKSFDMFDFIRCVEVKRNDNIVEIIVKSLDYDPTMKSIVDSAETHVVLASAKIDLDEEAELTGLNELAHRLLDTFYRSRVKVKKAESNVEESIWKCRIKEYSKTKTNNTFDTTLDFNAALSKIITSLKKKKFHLILTQNTILLLDQRSRLWDVNKK